MGTYTPFDHTADLGLEVRGRDLADLLATAARAVFDQVLEAGPASVEVRETVEVRPDPDLGPDPAEVLVGWLQELLYRFETRRLVPLTFAFAEASAEGARAEVGFGRFDPARHRARLEVKGVTYHGLEAGEETEAEDPEARWRARVILDV